MNAPRPTPPASASRFPWAKLARETPGGLPVTLVRLLIQPRASKTEVTSAVVEGRLKVRISAPPVDGEANEELCRFLAKQLRIPKSQVEVLRGATGRTKDLEITGASPDQIAQALGLSS